MIRSYRTTITTTGSAGTSTGTATTPAPLCGRILAINLDYSASQANTTDVTVTSATPAITILTRSNSATDGTFYPRVLLHDTSAAALTAVYDTIPVDGYITVAAAQGNNGETVAVTILYDED